MTDLALPPAVAAGEPREEADGAHVVQVERADVHQDADASTGPSHSWATVVSGLDELVVESEEAAEEDDATPKPTLPDALFQWEANKACDQAVTNFPTLFLNAFATDSLYQLLKTDISKTKVARQVFVAKCRPDMFFKLAFQT